MSREQIIRDTAYAIWEAEGRPDGRAAEHWRMAEVQVVASMTPPPKATGKAKAAARLATSKAAGAAEAATAKPVAATKPAAKRKSKTA